jgi:hypothetical protein
MALLLSVPSVFAVLACHWLGLVLIRPAFAASLRRFGPHGAWGEDLSLAVVIVMLVAWLFVDVALCAVILMARDGSIGFDQSFLFAIANFTTVGASAPGGSEFWGLAGPLVAMCGIFIFGWTTSFLVDCSHAVREFRQTLGRGPTITKR